MTIFCLALTLVSWYFSWIFFVAAIFSLGGGGDLRPVPLLIASVLFLLPFLLFGITAWLFRKTLGRYAIVYAAAPVAVGIIIYLYSAILIELGPYYHPYYNPANGPTVRYSDGKLSEVINRRNGLLNDHSVAFCPDGTFNSVSNFENGVKIGTDVRRDNCKDPGYTAAFYETSKDTPAGSEKPNKIVVMDSNGRLSKYYMNSFVEDIAASFEYGPADENHYLKSLTVELTNISTTRRTKIIRTFYPSGARSSDTISYYGNQSWRKTFDETGVLKTEETLIQDKVSVRKFYVDGLLKEERRFDPPHGPSELP